MRQYKKIIAVLTAAATGLVMSAPLNSEAADRTASTAQMKNVGPYEVEHSYELSEVPEEALQNAKKAVAIAEEQYREKKRKEEEARKAEEARRAKEEAERIAAEEAAAQQAAQEEAARQAAAEQAAVVQQTASQATAQQPAVAATSNEQALLAAIIFCEAGNQPYEGQVAVGAVIMNRVRSSVYPNSIAEVIYQSGQFGPAMTGWLDSVLASGSYTSTAMQAAADALAGSNPIGDCLYFGCGNYGIQIGDHFFH